MAKRKRRKSKPSRSRTTSGIESHVRRGKQLVPPFLALPNMQAQDWFRDVFPDMLWLCSRATFERRAADSLVHPTLRRIRAKAGDEAPLVDGSLCSLERVPIEKRDIILRDLRIDGLYEEAVPVEFAHALGLYPQAPGSWLIDGHLIDGLHVDPEIGHAHLEGIIRACFHGQSEPATFAKVLLVSQYLIEGRLRFPSDMEELNLLAKPLDKMTEDERAFVDGWVRATFSALYAASTDPKLAGDSDAQYGAAASAWAQRFWRSNFSLFPCRDWPTGLAGEPLTQADVSRLVAELQNQAEGVAGDLEERARLADPDLYSPDRYEVLVGIASRAVRLARLVATDPLLWAPEVVTPLLRQVTECLIVASWLVGRDDEAQFQRFKEYGRGHLKLLKLHLETAVEEGEEQEDVLEGLSDEVNADLWEEFQTIDLSGGFSGKNMRQMALDSDLKQEYDLVFAPASAEDHGEWTALDRYHLTRCAEPLHRFHRRPRTELSDVVRLDAVRAIIATAARVSDRVLASLGEPPLG